jgi:hypothetical protein
MLDDKLFFTKEITHNVSKIMDEVKSMNNKRIPLKTIYNYILTHTDTYQERYISLFLFGLSYRWFKDDNKLK